jgi:hypothetical protein
MSLAAIKRQLAEMEEQLAPASAELRLEWMAETPEGRMRLRRHEFLAARSLVRPLPAHLTTLLAESEESDLRLQRSHSADRRLIDWVGEADHNRILMLAYMTSVWFYVETPGVMEAYGLPGWERKLIEKTESMFDLPGLAGKTVSAQLRAEAVRIARRACEERGEVWD